MNETTVHGNITAQPVLRRGQSGAVFLTFTVAVNRSYYDRTRGTRIDQPAVFHDVIAFNVLAENAAHSLAKGSTVTVSGYLADNSFTPDGADQRVRRVRLEAGDIAVSLRFATAQVTKRTAERTDQPETAQPSQHSEPAEPAIA